MSLVNGELFDDDGSEERANREPLGDDVEAFLARELGDATPDELDEGSFVELINSIFEGAVSTADALSDGMTDDGAAEDEAADTELLNEISAAIVLGLPKSLVELYPSVFTQAGLARGVLKVALEEQIGSFKSLAVSVGCTTLSALAEAGYTVTISVPPEEDDNVD